MRNATARASHKQDLIAAVALAALASASADLCAQKSEEDRRAEGRGCARRSAAGSRFCSLADVQ
jgi:hypothetical protein